jgi:hypothetical protein
MTGKCIIDGVDIGSLGAFIVRDGDNDFISFPSRREPQNNDWYEYDGMDADLAEVYFKEKTVEVRFYIRGAPGARLEERLYGFFDLVSAPGVRSVYVQAFDRTFCLRYLDAPDMKQKGGLIKPGAGSAAFTVRFSMDDPMQLFTATDPQPTAPYSGKTYVEIDGNMATKKTKVSQLSEALSLAGLWILGVSNDNKSVKASMELLKGLNVELRLTATAIQWRREGGIWADLVAVSILQKPALDAAGALAEYLQGATAEVDALIAATEEARTTASNAAGAATTAAGSANTAATNANTAATAANTARDNATAATEVAVELNANPPKIVSGEWWVYNPDQHGYVNTGLPARGPKGDTGDTGRPLIVLPNGNYGNWNPETGEYEDSGVEAAATVDTENRTVTFTEAEEKTDIASGDAFPVLFGKIKKWLSSLGALAWKSTVDYATEVTGNP